MKIRITKSGNVITYVICNRCKREMNPKSKKHSFGTAFWCDGKVFIRKSDGLVVEDLML